MLARQIKSAADAAQIGSDIGWHTFRHTYSSMLRHLGVDLKVQQELLRHTDIRTTMNVYTQAVSEQKRSAHSSVVRLVLTLTKPTERRRLDICGHGTEISSSVLSNLMVGAIGFEPTTPCAQGRCATRLRYAPTFTALRGCSAPFRILLQGSEMEQGLPAVVALQFAYGAALFA